ncbi:MAG TPA: NTP transferase domain-containing protein [Gammaproteobacteria bacterium]|nr:NTP transferase domain-containing protein [Gammaproteobacteria bacterium]
MRTGSDKFELAGLVLAGGRSRRMGEDKGSQSYAGSGVPAVRLAIARLEAVCARVFVSINAEQRDDPVYARLTTIVDSQPDRGPAAGLAAAFDAAPESAWLVLAVDMPLVSIELLRNLVAQRDPSRIATVQRHADGTLEPLCAIWEPHAREPVAHELAHGRDSLRAVAHGHAAAIAGLPQPERLRNANTPAERELLRSCLERDGRGPDHS